MNTEWLSTVFVEKMPIGGKSCCRYWGFVLCLKNRRGLRVAGKSRVAWRRGAPRHITYGTVCQVGGTALLAIVPQAIRNCRETVRIAAPREKSRGCRYPFALAAMPKCSLAVALFGRLNGSQSSNAKGVKATKARC